MHDDEVAKSHRLTLRTVMTEGLVYVGIDLAKMRSSCTGWQIARKSL